MASLVLLLGLFVDAPKVDEPTYYMTVFAYEGTPKPVRSSHTFATFIKLDGDKADVKTISWLPKTGNIILVRVGGEAGRNFTLKETMDFAASNGAKVYQWGPYQVKKEMHDRAEKQVARLEKGTIGYRAVDNLLRPEKASNCIHAVCDIDADDGLLETGTAFGRAASSLIVKHFRRWIIDPDKRHEEINKRLGLKEKDVKSEK